MTLFKKKVKATNSALFALLDDKLRTSRENQLKYFYYPLASHQISEAEKWCHREHCRMEISHKNDGVIVYKIIF